MKAIRKGHGPLMHVDFPPLGKFQDHIAPHDEEAGRFKAQIDTKQGNWTLHRKYGRAQPIRPARRPSIRDE